MAVDTDSCTIVVVVCVASNTPGPLSSPPGVSIRLVVAVVVVVVVAAGT